MSAFLDTNILLYASNAGDDQAKYEIARGLLRSDDCVLSVQVLNEFVVQATKQSRDDRLTMDQALAYIQALRRFRILPLDLALFDTAQDVRRRTRYNWWDCLIVAAAITAGCDRLLTEDLQHGRVIDGVRIVNPFRELA